MKELLFNDLIIKANILLLLLIIILILIIHFIVFFKAKINPSFHKKVALYIK